VNVDLQLKPGEWVSITGPSGAGKSTLLNVIGCLDQPTSGSYRFEDIEVPSLSDKERTGLRSRRIGFVFQSFHLLPHRTVLENVMLAEVYRKQSFRGRKERAMAAIDKVGLHERADFLPAKLSGGERQRVAIARAIMGSPSLLLCDEPTGNLDSKSTESLLDLFTELNRQGLTLVIVTHEENVASRASRRVQIIDGQLTEVAGRVDWRNQGSLAELGSPERKSPANTWLPLAGIFDTSDLQKSAIAPAVEPASASPAKPASGKGKTIARSGMTIRDLFDEAIAGMFARPGRTMLTVLGIVIGLTALVATIGLTRTANNRIVSQFDRLAATEIVVTARSSARGISDPRAIPWDAPSRLRRLNGVDAAGTLSELDIGLRLVSSSLVKDPTSQTAFSMGVHAASPGLYDAVWADLQVGRFPDRGHSERADRVAVLGPRAALRLGIVSLAQLPAIAIGDHLYLVIGVLRDVGRQPQLLSSVIIPEGTAMRDFGLLGPGSVIIATRVGAARLIAKQTPYALRPDKEGVLRVRKPPELRRVRDDVKTDLDVVFLLLGGLSLIVGAIMIGNITLVSVIERTGEIGLRRAIGATRGHIVVQFLLESTAMGTIGGILGASVGILIVMAVSAYQVWTPVLDPSAPFLAPIIGGVVGLVSGTYPALRAARLEPVEAFRN
jgi:macrolide transport system ATP-binding/permease protein